MVKEDFERLSSSRILLVDGDDSTRTSMIAYFGKFTRQFTAVESAEEALPLLTGPLWDVVVCNLKLPGINGLGFSRLASQKKPGTKIILATQYSYPALKEKAADYGIVEIISAPLVPEILASVLIQVHLNIESTESPMSENKETSFDVPDVVSIHDLNDRMIITAFIRFAEKYSAISPKTCAWIQHNFKGARTVVNRKGAELSLLVEELEPGDDLKKLYQFPITLMNLTFVRNKLIKELKARGFLAFEVKRKPTEHSLEQQIRLAAIRQTERFIDKVSESVTVRDSVSETVKEMISDGDLNELATDDLVNHVNKITKDGTADALSVIAVLKKSDPTFMHCIDVGAIFLTVYSHWIEAKKVSNRFENEAEILLSAILHDIGKLLLPIQLLESSATFDVDSREMQMMRNHPIDSARILSDLYLPDVAINMALYHHVKVNASLLNSYPKVVGYDRVALETRLLAIADMFQALVGGRPYKRRWHPRDAMKYIDQLAGVECDEKVWTAFQEALGWYPTGSLVELNDGSQAFVVDRAIDVLDRPSVVVTRNSFNEELTHNTFIDLNTEKDIFIEKGLDHFQIYGETAINRFTQMKVC